MSETNTGQRFSRLTFLEGFFARAVGKARTTCPYQHDETARSIWLAGWQHHADRNASGEDVELGYAQVGQMGATV